MKLCLCCKNTADDAAPTCLACGEASFGASDAVPKEEGGDVAPGPYDGLVKKQLLELAKARGIEGASSLNKTKLLEALLASDAVPKEEGGDGAAETNGEGASE